MALLFSASNVDFHIGAILIFCDLEFDSFLVTSHQLLTLVPLHLCFIVYLDVHVQCRHIIRCAIGEGAKLSPWS